MNRSKLLAVAAGRLALVAMTAFTLVVAVRVLGSPGRAPQRGVAVLVVEEDGSTTEAQLPPGHPPLDACPELPPGHPSLSGELPPGHPPVGVRRLPAAHPPVEGLPRPMPTFPQDGTSTI